MILEISRLSKSFGTEQILSDISFSIRENQKCALIGSNGCGKTTLLKILAGEYSYDSGSVNTASGVRIGYLSQDHEIDSDLGLYEFIRQAKSPVFEMEEKLRELEASMKSKAGKDLENCMKTYANLSHDYEMAEGFAAESLIKGVIAGLGFSKSDYGRKVKTMSGGEKTRAALGKLLLDRYDLLMLDEPTNHLDLKAVEWLESFLTSYKNSVLVVSHDRFFLDRIVTRVVEIENGKSLCYEGNYTQFSQKKEQLRREQKKAWLNQQAQIKHQEAVIEKLRSFNREKSIKRAESREKALAKIERVEKPVTMNADMRLTFTPAIISGKDVLRVQNLSKAFHDRILFKDLNIELFRGEKTALIGDNGTGKSTILRILNNKIPGDSGSFSFGANVIPAYYDQEQHILDSNNTVFEEISDAYPEMSNTDIRNVCAGFLFTGDDVFKKIGSLSGGEKARLSLAKLMLTGANLIMLDEPTNHLDIVSREILEEALKGYEGTVFFVSHDRYFINRVADRILELKDGALTQYQGDYDYYVRRKAEALASAAAVSDSDIPALSSENKSDWQEYKKEKSKAQKRAADIARAEKSIEEHENLIKALDEKLLDPAIATDAAALSEVCEKKGQLEEELEELYALWEELSS